MRYLVVIRRTTTGYSADVPDLQGCVATGTTVEHTRQMIAGAIEMHLELMRRSGEQISEPAHSMEFTVDDSSAEELCTWVEADLPEVMSP
jgi:predicted RNase H-like HicB family nuclease